MPESTTIRVTHDTWRELHQRKGPGDSMNDVIQRLLADEDNSTPTPTPESPERPAADSEVIYTADDLRHDLANPGDEYYINQRVEAVEAAVAYLHEHGEAKKEELQDALYESHSAGYDTPGSWWKNCITQAFAGLRERGVIELAVPSRGIYTAKQ